MDRLNALIEALLSAVGSGRAAWPDVGVFGLQSRKRMPGFPGFTRVQYWPSEHLYKLLNNGEAPAVLETAPAFATDAEFADRIARTIAAELQAKGEVTIPGFGSFGVERRKTTQEDQYSVSFRSDPALLRRLNPADKDYDAALAWEWPGGPPTPTPPIDAN